MHLRQVAGASIRIFLPLSLIGPKPAPYSDTGGEEDQRGEGSRVGPGGYPPKVCHPPLDPTQTYVLYFLQSRPDTHLKEVPKHHGETPETRPEDSTSKPIPKTLAQARGSSQRSHLLTTGPVIHPPVPRRWMVHPDSLRRTLLVGHAVYALPPQRAHLCRRLQTRRI